MAQTTACALDATAAALRVAIAEERSCPLKHIQRACIILPSAGCLSIQGVARRAGVSRPAVWRLQRRYAEAGVDGRLRNKMRPRGTPPHPIKTVAELLALTCSELSGEVAHWSGRAVAQVVGISLRTVLQMGWGESRIRTTSAGMSKSA